MEKASIMDCFLGNKKRIYKYLGKRTGRYTGYKDINGVSIRIGDIVYSPNYPMVSVVSTSVNGIRDLPCCYCDGGLSQFTDECIVVGTENNHKDLLVCNDFWYKKPTIYDLEIVAVNGFEVRKLIKEGKIHSVKTKGGHTKLSRDDVNKAFEEGLLMSFIYTDFDFNTCTDKFERFVFDRFKQFESQLFKI